MQNIQSWQRDIDTLQQWRSDLNDRLYIERDELLLIKGTHPRALGVSITPKPDALAQHIDKLLGIAKQIFEDLEKNRAEYEEVTRFRMEVKSLKKSISDLKLTFQRHDYNNPIYENLYENLFKTSSQIYLSVKQHKNDLKKPSVETRPKRPVEYNERTELASIRYFPSKRATISDILNAAKEALRLATLNHELNQQTRLQKTLRIMIRVGILTPVYFAAALAQAPKILCWDPLERRIFGEQRTEPFYEKILRMMTENSTLHREAFQGYANQLLRFPIITDEAADAFCELAPHASELDLQNVILGSANLLDFEPYIKPEALPPNEFLKAAQDWLKKSEHFSINLEDIERSYQENDQAFISQKKSPRFCLNMIAHLNIESITYEPNMLNPHISPRNLFKLLDAAVRSPSCKTLIISSHLMKIADVKGFLQKQPYQEVEWAHANQKHTVFVRQET